MIKVTEFSPALTSNHEHSAIANCKVVINGSTPQVKSRGTPEPNIPTYPAPTTEDDESPITYRVSDSPANEVGYTSYEPLYRHLVITYGDILRTNNSKLLANIIDCSGKVILPARELLTTIALMLGMEEQQIRLSYEDPDSTCLSKVSPIKNIATIKVNGYDFNLAYNHQYNELSDVFGVSLTRCLIG